MQLEESKPALEAVPIWRCRDEACKAWIREELAGPGGQPVCPLCKGAMVRSFKHLPKLVKKHKGASRRKTQESPMVH